MTSESSPFRLKKLADALVIVSMVMIPILKRHLRSFRGEFESCEANSSLGTYVAFEAPLVETA